MLAFLTCARTVKYARRRCVRTCACVQAIFSKVSTFVEEFHAGKPAGHTADAPSARPVVKDHHSGSAAAATAADKSAAGGKAAAARSGGAGSSGQTIVMKETFYAGAAPTDPRVRVQVNN